MEIKCTLPNLVYRINKKKNFYYNFYVILNPGKHIEIFFLCESNQFLELNEGTIKIHEA